MIEDFKKDATARMAKCVQQFQADLKKLRTGRAHPSLIENLKVDYYGTETPLQQLANIGIEDARTLVVTPWDKAAVQAVEKAVYKSDLGLTPNTAGTVIRIPLPPLTEERRRDITKVVRGDAEGARVAVRNVRRDVLQDVKEALKEKMISQDEEKKAQEEIQRRRSCRSDALRPASFIPVSKWSCLPTSRSSWMATADGPRPEARRAPPVIVRASSLCAASSASARVSACRR